MRILLVGEYSRLHNSLKEGLQKLGHQVVLVGMGDGFKNFPVDIPINKKYQKGLKRRIKNAIFVLFKIDLESLQINKQIKSLEPELSNFDVVQFINEASFNCSPNVEQEIFDNIRSWNKAAFLLSCGSDVTSINYAYQKKLRYSVLTPYLEGKDTKNKHAYGLKFLTKEFRNLHDHLYKHIKGIIASDIDYHLPLMGHPKYLGLVPNPINTDILRHEPLNPYDKITIFHGINANNYYKKGNDLFEMALRKIKSQFQDKVHIITSRSLPYNEYIKAYEKADILLDMVYAYDQGFNALEAMARGKVVFTGAEQEWLNYYELEEDTVAINALPDVDAIVTKLRWLIANPEQIIAIGKNARRFIEEHHNYVISAQRYLDLWKSKLSE